MQEEMLTLKKIKYIKYKHIKMKLFAFLEP